MHAELPVLSFICAIVLVALAPLHWRSRNVAMLSLIGWLFAGNFIHGVNSIIWAGNVETHAPIWCDIGTKVVHGMWIALPGCCFCICRHLTVLSSNSDTSRQRHRTLIECALCIVLPLFFMAFHVIVQDHRFDLVADLGCVSSIFPSTPAIILVWLPPLILSCLSISYMGIAAYRYFYHSAILAKASLSFLRPLITALIITLLVIAATSVSIFGHLASSGGLQPYTSWSSVHAQLSVIRIVPGDSRPEMIMNEMMWWMIPSISLVFVAASVVGLVCGERCEPRGSHSLSRWVHGMVLRQSYIDPFESKNFPTHVVLGSAHSAPVLESKWNTTQSSSRSFVKDKPKSRPPPISVFGPFQPRASPPPSPSPESDTFTASTLLYLESSTGQAALNLPSLRTIQPQNNALPSSMTVESTPQLKPARFSAQSNSSTSPTQSILAETWPQPPSMSTPLATPVVFTAPRAVHLKVPKGKRPSSSSSITTSLASSTISTHAYALDHMFLDSPVQHVIPPFQGPGIVPASDRPRQTGAVRRTASRETLSPKSLSLSLKARPRERAEAGDGIFLSVVQETSV